MSNLSSGKHLKYNTYYIKVMFVTNENHKY